MRIPQKNPGKKFPRTKITIKNFLEENSQKNKIWSQIKAKLKQKQKAAKFKPQKWPTPNIFEATNKWNIFTSGPP